MSLEPLNKKERAKAQRRFLWVYILSIIIPCIAVYFLARSSDSRLASENSQLRSLLRLVTAVDSVGKETRILNEIDARFKNSSEKILSSQDQLLAETSETNLRTVITALRKDSASVVSSMSPPNREYAASVIKNLGVFLQDWITIKDLRKSVKNQGIDVSELETCKGKLEAAQNKIDNLSMMMAAMGKSGGGGGGGGGNSKELEELKMENAELKAQAKAAGKSAPKMDVFCEAKVVRIEGAWLKKAADEGKSARRDIEILKFYNQAFERYKRLLDITRIQPALSNYREEAEDAMADIDRKRKALE